MFSLTAKTFCCCIGVLFCESAAAQFEFDFIDSSNVAIARLTLSDISSDPNDIIMLTFTQAGQDLFGYGPVYEGVFDALSLAEEGGRFILDEDEFGRVGLGGTSLASSVGFSVSAFDTNPPTTSLLGFDANQFGIIAVDEVVVGPPQDFIVLTPFPDGRGIESMGQWVLVPEPDGVNLSCVILIALIRVFASRELRSSGRHAVRNVPRIRLSFWG